MNRAVWDRVEAILTDAGVAPVLAVVPDNQDVRLRVSNPDASFWDRVRSWQSRGWTIGMHGHQHRFVTTCSGMLRVNAYSEFAGLPEAEQERKVRAGLALFESQGVRSGLWVAPAHSFDETTLDVLKRLGFTHISDGYSGLPYRDHLGLTWIPQQLWSFRRRPFGVWTICFHINSWSERDVAAFEENVKRHRRSISSFDEVCSLYSSRRHSIMDAAWAAAYRLAIDASGPIRSSRSRLESALLRKRPSATPTAV
jgi:peptidoglycan/xylan/chitin deacetylase (PgdA/CDA1 family)